MQISKYCDFLSLESPRKFAEVVSYLEIQALRIHEFMYNQSLGSLSLTYIKQTFQ